ncbi:hypothetical protein HNP02_007557 [Mycobacterium sp. AZCC_0083]|nr:hypothetical protein [Mycobacterium sp. AZCC_0083]
MPCASAISGSSSVIGTLITISPPPPTHRSHQRSTCPVPLHHLAHHANPSPKWPGSPFVE